MLASDPKVKAFFDKIGEEPAIGLTSEAKLAEHYYKTCRKSGKERLRFDISCLRVRSM